MQAFLTFVRAFTREYERFRAFSRDYEHSLAITSGYEHSRAFTSNCERLRAFTRYFPKVGIESGTVDVREADSVTGEGHVFLPEDKQKQVKLAMVSGGSY